MLKGIHPCISPELLKALAEMGHGDEIVLADAHFPGHTVNPRVLRADGLTITTLLEGILPLFELDLNADPLVMMSAMENDRLDPIVEARYLKIVHQHIQDPIAVVRMERFAFYQRAQKAFVVVMTGETVQYGNVILKKGVTPIQSSKILRRQPEHNLIKPEYVS
jgi:L-fucose mutarotase